LGTRLVTEDFGFTMQQFRAGQTWANKPAKQSQKDGLGGWAERQNKQSWLECQAAEERMFGRACVVDEANRHVAVVVDKEVVKLDGRRVDMLHFKHAD
jgi:hypothetical protein